MTRSRIAAASVMVAAWLAVGCSGGGGDSGCKSDADCAGLTCCGGACVDLATDEGHCGACATACGASDTCCGGGCVDTRTSVANCGACGTACTTPANGTAACAASACGIATCDLGFADCDDGAANGCEVNTVTDVQNCGACGAACAAVANGTPGCSGSACVVASCEAGFGDCDAQLDNGCETNTDTSVANCGACGAACAAVANGTPGCSAAACTIASCDAGFANCDLQLANGCEIDTNTSVTNCGACGVVCPVIANGTPACTAAACTVASCNAGFGNCDGVLANGCETNTNTSVANCGACGTICAIANGTPGCASGTCTVASCNAGFANCNGAAADGCEINTTNDPNNCGGCGIACGAGAVCVASACKDRVLVVGAPATASWNDDVRSKLLGTGAFATVDTFAAATATPTLAQLRQYAAVLVYSDTGFLDATALGNNLADYFDGGGRVVTAVFANASLPIGGRWATGGYPLIATGSQASPTESLALGLLEPSSPLLTGVATLTATAGFKSPGALINGGVRVANWGSGAPLVVRGQKNGRVRVELNFYPPSSTVRSDFWVGSGATLMKNALAFKGYCHDIVGTGGNVCPSTRTSFCDSAPLVATSATQAKLACDTCYGISCFLETADCSGQAYGPKAAGQYVLNDAYFGYQAGCGGAAGRIWPIGNSYSTLGRWAP